MHEYFVTENVNLSAYFEKKKWNAFVYALISLVLRGEDAGWRKRLVSC